MEHAKMADMPESFTFLLKPGELTLKGGNRGDFEQVLKRNLSTLLQSAACRVRIRDGRFFLHCPREISGQAEDALDRLFGIAGWAKTRTSDKELRNILKACVEEAKTLAEGGIRSFKVEARRSDKSFPLNSYGICCAAGDAVREELPALTVNVRSPEAVISVEIREKAYIYSLEKKGRGGLPVGTAGRGLLLLSGGIDSPVAGYLMAGRGMGIDAVYFHTPPYTSQEALDKVVTLAEILGRYTMGVKLRITGFTEVQKRIKERGPLPWTTVLLRMAMMEGAEKIARKQGDKCLITGESLSQVASQTVENIACTQSRAGLPVLRPLIGMDKEGIIKIAQAIGTYESSILPYPDCCILFSPPHPVLRGNPMEARSLYAALDASPLIDQALGRSELKKCGI
ncbi:MAG: tRNA 4-thiouridine(8) synthase ThiI [Spirochaetaceae bacterium]|jgi:thiamine biosynthesis protein ThiI|nr:tRNA 4-thiouridine(8) synthase ThiI [Spirochaetaceae bacterium]